MRLLVAAQGTGPGEFTWTVPGELVHPSPMCALDCTCPCSRALIGLASGRATTAAIVTELAIDLGQLAEIVLDSHSLRGFDLTPSEAREMAEEMEFLGRGWAVGWLVRRSGDTVEVR